MSEEQNSDLDTIVSVLSEMEAEDNPVNEDHVEEQNENTADIVDDNSGDDGHSGVEETDEGGVDGPLAERAREYGLNPDLFDDTEALQGQIDSIDRMWAQRAAQQRQAAFQQKQQVQQPAQPQQVQQPTDGTPIEPVVPFRLELDPEDYPPELIDKMNSVFDSIHKHYSPLQEQVQQLLSQSQQQQAQVEQQNQQRLIEDFMQSVGSLGHKQLFGDGVNPTPEQSANVSRLFQEADAMALGLQMRGLPVPSMEELVRRAETISFAKELQAYKSQTANARLVRQANQRLGSGSRSTRQAKGAWSGEPETNPDLLSAYDRMIAERSER